MEQLKVGDKVYYKDYNRWTQETTYNLQSVERLTKTQAILSNGTKLINTPSICYLNKEVCFDLYGNRYKKWYIQNDEVIKEAKTQNENKIIKNWFNNKTFSLDEIKLIYNELVLKPKHKA
jgi:hypothetical protein